MSDIIQEKLIEKQPIPVSIEGTKKILFQMENCICKIYLEDGQKGTGFFCKILFNNDLLPVLITNNHVLNEKDIENNKIIQLNINDEVKEIEIDNSRKRYTNSDENIDITIIKIKPNKDKIYNFQGIFGKYSSLSEIKGLENWNVSNGNNFSYMFYECSLLSDIKALQN